MDPNEAYLRAVETTKPIYEQSPYAEELPKFTMVYNGEISGLSEPDIGSSGYVIHTLEASIWCLLSSSSFEGSVLKAVNLGEDTDTTATVTGGLAGAHYGVGPIPDKWLVQLARRADLEAIFDSFTSLVES